MMKMFFLTVIVLLATNGCVSKKELVEPEFVEIRTTQVQPLQGECLLRVVVVGLNPPTTLEAIPEEEPKVVETWYTPDGEARRLKNSDELQKTLKEAERKGVCMCAPGDPLCSCL